MLYAPYTCMRVVLRNICVNAFTRSSCLAGDKLINGKLIKR